MKWSLAQWQFWNFIRSEKEESEGLAQRRSSWRFTITWKVVAIRIGFQWRKLVCDTRASCYIPRGAKWEEWWDEEVCVLVTVRDSWEEIQFFFSLIRDYCFCSCNGEVGLLLRYDRCYHHGHWRERCSCLDFCYGCHFHQGLHLFPCHYGQDIFFLTLRWRALRNRRYWRDWNDWCEYTQSIFVPLFMDIIVESIVVATHSSCNCSVLCFRSFRGPFYRYDRLYVCLEPLYYGGSCCIRWCCCHCGLFRLLMQSAPTFSSL